MKLFNTIILTLLVSASVFAQRPDREKIKTLKIAHITEQLDLTEAEAQKFWPIYNANEEAVHKLRAKSDKKRKDRNTDELTESEAKTLLLEMEAHEKKRAELHSKMLNDLLEFLPAKKILKLFQAERSFKRKMIQEFKSRHSGERGDRRKN